MRFSANLGSGMLGKKVDVHEQQRWGNLEKTLNNNVEFGGVANQQNIKGTWLSVTAPATPDTDFTVNHNLGTLPTGVHIMQKDMACDVYTGSVPATKSAITLRATAASAVLSLFIHMFILAALTTDDVVKECKDQGLIVEYNTHGEIIGCVGKLVPKNCVSTIGDDGSTNWVCDAPQQPEPAIEPSKAPAKPGA